MKRDLTMLKTIIKADYHRHVKRFSTLTAHKDIVFIGDSIVAYFPLKSFGYHENIHNLGIPGDTTKGVYDRLEQVISLKPKYVILHIGLNDEVLLEHTVDETINDIKHIIETLTHALRSTTVFVVSLTPINQSHFPHGTYVIDRNPSFSINVNKALKQFKGITYIDLYNQLIDEHGELDHRFTTDGIHLNQQGYYMYINLLESFLKKLQNIHF